MLSLCGSSEPVASTGHFWVPLALLVRWCAGWLFVFLLSSLFFAKYVISCLNYLLFFFHCDLSAFVPEFVMILCGAHHFVVVSVLTNYDYNLNLSYYALRFHRFNSS